MDVYVCLWVCPPEVARSIRRPRPNLMKLSGFVELVSLIILVTAFFKFDRFFTEIQVKNCRCISGIFAIFCKKNDLFAYREIDETTSLIGRITKPMTYSESSHRAASESLKTKKHFSDFHGVLVFCQWINVL